MPCERSVFHFDPPMTRSRQTTYRRFVARKFRGHLVSTSLPCQSTRATAVGSSTTGLLAPTSVLIVENGGGHDD
jgi:hypothetical protein